MSVFSDRLRWVREQAGISQKEMAEKLGISQQVYSNIETGRNEPNLELLKKIPSVLNTTLDFLVGVTDFDKRLKLYFIYYKHIKEKIESIEFRIGHYFERLKDSPDAYNELMKKAIDELNDVTKETYHSVTKLEKYYKSIPGRKITDDNEIMEYFDKLTPDELGLPDHPGPKRPLFD